MLFFDLFSCRSSVQLLLQLENVFVMDDCVHLVFEYVETDLEKLIRDKTLFLNEGVVKSLMYMVTAGVKACHDRFVLHRVGTYFNSWRNTSFLRLVRFTHVCGCVQYDCRT